MTGTTFGAIAAARAAARALEATGLERHQAKPS